MSDKNTLKGKSVFVMGGGKFGGGGAGGSW